MPVLKQSSRETQPCYQILVGPTVLELLINTIFCFSDDLLQDAYIVFIKKIFMLRKRTKHAQFQGDTGTFQYLGPPAFQNVGLVCSFPSLISGVATGLARGGAECHP